jgi:hypothetical protein
MEALAAADDLPRFTANDIEGEQCPKCLQNLGKQIADHLQRARKAEEKAEQHYIAVLQLLEKAKQDCDEGGFAAFQEKFCPDLGRSRVFELKAIATGKKTLEDTRAATRERVARHRARQVESVTVTDSSPTADSSPSPTMPATDTDESGAQRKRENERLFGEDHAKADALAPNAVPDDQLIRADEAAAAGSVEAAAILEEFFSSATTADILARLPPATLDQIREQVVSDFFAQASIDSIFDEIPRAHCGELLDLCMSACAVSTLVTPTRTDKKLLSDLTGTLHWTLNREDISSAGDGVKIIRGKLAANKRDARELRLIFVKGK